MAHAAALGPPEPAGPIRVEHDRRRRQFTVRLNAERNPCLVRRARMREMGRTVVSGHEARWAAPWFRGAKDVLEVATTRQCCSMSTWGRG
ncbi:protein NATD1 isoform X2 [Alligator mississippiensis]|uniref:protein NATD1 isoform X2 n=1 Tax=Alligator mississippiensis TaxID=8496 RepID=UPI002877EBB9|nr:protein NATD1 isoform X2 [Alligator mississippiensis]